MLKRLSVIAAVFFLLTAFANPVLAEICDATKAINDAKTNYGYSDVNKLGEAIHYITDTGLSNLTDGNGYSYGFLTYGQPHGDKKNGRYRYIGYTFYGEDYTNMDFPADKNANGADFTSRNWIPQPWNNSAVRASNPQLKQFPGDGDPANHAVILGGIMAYGGTNANNGYTISGASNPSFWNEVEHSRHLGL